MPRLLDVTNEKVLRNILAKNQPITEVNEEKKLEIIADLYHQFANIESIKVIYFTTYFNEVKVHKNKIVVTANTPNGSFDFYLYFNDRNQLIISFQTCKNYFFGSVENLLALRDEFEKEIELAEQRAKINKQNEIKKGKVKELKKNAILIKLYEIAEQEGFECMIDKSYTTKIKLYVRLGKNDYMEIDVPYTNFQEVLQNVAEAYHSIKKLKDKNIPIKIKYSIHTYDMEWKTKKKE